MVSSWGSTEVYGHDSYLDFPLEFYIGAYNNPLWYVCMYISVCFFQDSVDLITPLLAWMLPFQVFWDHGIVLWHRQFATKYSYWIPSSLIYVNTLAYMYIPVAHLLTCFLWLSGMLTIILDHSLLLSSSSSLVYVGILAYTYILVEWLAYYHELLVQWQACQEMSYATF